MKKEFKGICPIGLVFGIFFCAAGAYAEVSISMTPVGYTPKPVVWGQGSRPSTSERLSEAAERLADAAGSGDNAKAEALLAGLYSGAAGKEAAAPVYIGARQAAPVPAVPAPVKRAAVVYKSAAEDLGAEANAAVSKKEAGKKDAAPEAAPASKDGGKDEGGKTEEKKEKSHPGDLVLIFLVLFFLFLL